MTRNKTLPQHGTDQFSICSCHLLSIGEVPWTWDIAGIDGITNDNVESLLC